MNSDLHFLRPSIDLNSLKVWRRVASLLALAGVAQWIERGLRTRGLPVRFLVRAHAWVADQVPSGESMRGNHTLMFLSLSFSFSSSLSKNK